MSGLDRAGALLSALRLDDCDSDDSERREEIRRTTVVLASLNDELERIARAASSHAEALEQVRIRGRILPVLSARLVENVPTKRQLLECFQAGWPQVLGCEREDWIGNILEGLWEHRGTPDLKLLEVLIARANRERGHVWHDGECESALLEHLFELSRCVLASREFFLRVFERHVVKKIPFTTSELRFQSLLWTLIERMCDVYFLSEH